MTALLGPGNGFEGELIRTDKVNCVSKNGSMASRASLLHGRMTVPHLSFKPLQVSIVKER